MDLLERKRVRDAVTACRNCSLGNKCSGPVPFSGPSHGVEIAVVGEAPGKVEDEQGTPFIGPAGQLLRYTLSDVGVEPDRVAFINAVSCFPNRTPTTGEVAACRANLDAQLGVVRPAVILGVGGVALGALGWGWSRISEARGHWLHTTYDQDSGTEARGTQPIPLLPTWHPSAVLRNSELREEFVEDLACLSTCGLGSFGLHWKWNCVKCGVYTTIRVDIEGKVTQGLGLPLCAKHYAVRAGIAGQGKQETKRKGTGRGAKVRNPQVRGGKRHMEADTLGI